MFHVEQNRFDVVVVGGGHAGCEAVAVVARLGAKAALVSMRLHTIGVMSCNPAIGGVGKGHLVREVDAFGGLIARAADHAAIQYRMLNRSKGPAVHGPRIQADRRRFRSSIRAALAKQDGVSFIEGEVASLVLEGRAVRGVKLSDGSKLFCGAVVIATGTFLGGRLHCGERQRAGGRSNEPAAISLAKQLRALELPIARLKTGTPPRIDGRTIDWASVERQASDDDPWTMSPATEGRPLPQIACGITHTTEATHAIIAAARDLSPLHNGAIEGRGPRYCPSIEDKVSRFADRPSHQVFLEPEGLDDATVYPNGISTSLPARIQADFVRTVPGLEHAAIVQPGYAVEYDFVDPRSLDRRLAVEQMPGLFLAGQINGTTGYEEAAAQGLVAGINAAIWAGGRDAFVFQRDTSYIGVLVDDLVLQGVTEPYRMLTARAEHRLRLRADNAMTRLGDAAAELGTLSGSRTALQAAHGRWRSEVLAHLQRKVSPAAMPATVRNPADSEAKTLFDWLRSPHVDWSALVEVDPWLESVPVDLRAELTTDSIYAPYVQRGEQEAARVSRDERIGLPASFEFRAVKGLSTEMIERLTAASPRTLAEAGRVRGITPAALTALLAAARRAA